METRLEIPTKSHKKFIWSIQKYQITRTCFSAVFRSFTSFFRKWKRLYLIKNATTELYKNLSYMTLSGARNLEFEAVSDFIAWLSVIIRGNTIQNINNTKDENISLADTNKRRQNIWSYSKWSVRWCDRNNGCAWTQT